MAENDKQVDARKEPLCILVGILKFLDPKNAKVEDSVQDAKVEVLVDALKADDGWEKIKVISLEEEFTLRAYIYKHLQHYSIPTEQFPLHDEWNAFKTDAELQRKWINTVKMDKPGKFDQRAYDSFDKLVKLSNMEVNAKSTRPRASSSTSGLPLNSTRRLNTPARNRPGQVKQNDAMLCIALGVLKFLKEGDKVDDLDKMLETKEGWSKVVLKKKLKIVVNNEIDNENVKIANFHSYWIQMKTDTDFKEKFRTFKTAKKQSFLEATWNSFEKLLKHQDKDGSSTGGNSEIDVDNEIDKVQVMQGIAQGVLKALEYKVPINDLREKLATNDGWDSIEIKIILKDFIERKLRAYGHKNFSIHSNWKRIKSDTNSRTTFFEQVRNNLKNIFSDNDFDSFEKLIEEGVKSPVSKRRRLNPLIEIQKIWTTEELKKELRDLWLKGAKVEEAKAAIANCGVPDKSTVLMDFFTHGELQQDNGEEATDFDHKEQHFAMFLLEILKSDGTLKKFETSGRMTMRGRAGKFSDKETQSLFKVVVSYVQDNNIKCCRNCHYRVLKSEEWNCPTLKRLLKTDKLDTRTPTALSERFKNLLKTRDYEQVSTLSQHEKETLNTLADVISKNTNDAIYKCASGNPRCKEDSIIKSVNKLHDKALEILSPPERSASSETIWGISTDWIPHPINDVHGLKISGKELDVALMFLTAAYHRLLDAQKISNLSNEEFLLEVEEAESGLIRKICETMDVEQTELIENYLPAAMKIIDLFDKKSDKKNDIQLTLFDITKTETVQVSSRNFEAYFKFLAIVCYAANALEVPGVPDEWNLLKRDQIKAKFSENAEKLRTECQLPLYGLAFQVLNEKETIVKLIVSQMKDVPYYHLTKEGKPFLVPNVWPGYEYSMWIPVSIAEYVHYFLIEEELIDRSQEALQRLKFFWNRDPVIKDLTTWLVIQTFEKGMITNQEPKVVIEKRKKCFIALPTGTMETLDLKQFNTFMFNCFSTKEMQEGKSGYSERLTRGALSGEHMERCAQILLKNQEGRMILGKTQAVLKGLSPFVKTFKSRFESGRIGMLYEYHQFLRFGYVEENEKYNHSADGAVEYLKSLECQNILSTENVSDMFDLIDAAAQEKVAYLNKLIAIRKQQERK